MLETILCSNCNRTSDLKDSYNCGQCGKFFCDSCTVEKDQKLLCVTCYSSGLSNRTRMVLDEVLSRKGVKLEGPKLVFRGMEIKELSDIRVGESGRELSVKCGGKSFSVDRQTFEQLWKNALEMGYKTQRIPFGQRVVM